MIPFPEYPRPQLRRREYTILNGLWDYAFTKSSQRPERYDGKILVPFSPETKASGVERILMPWEFLHYRRTISLGEIPAGKRLLLHFGAVDESASVRINGRSAGIHRGGYLPFELDITDLVHAGSNELTLSVKDRTEYSFCARGKQRLLRGGMFYTSQSGIWKSVWMEWVPAVHIAGLRMVPDIDRGILRLTVEAVRGCRENVREDAGQRPLRCQDPLRRPSFTAVVSRKGLAAVKISGHAWEEVCIPLPDAQLWTPQHPALYDLTVRLQEDEVQSYFAMRKFSVEKDRHGTPRFFLNNKPYFLNGVLDQGYWPGSLMTPPSDRAWIRDIRGMKGLGFNMLRKHVKIEADRFYYHCDRIGMLVWQDMPCGGEVWNMFLLGYLPNMIPPFGRAVRDGAGSRWFFSRNSLQGRVSFTRELTQMVQHLRNVPSICVWGPFNEGWGQFDADFHTDLIRRLDNTRPVDQASGWFDQGGGDFYSIHNYFRPLKVKCRTRVTALTEYGGYSCRIPGKGGANGMPAYQSFRSPRELNRAWVLLMKNMVYPNIRRGLSAAVYTQLSDIEEEINGILTYDRKVIKLRPQTVRRMNRILYKEFERSVR